MKVILKRVYDEPEKSDGLRIFVDRFWPRGMKKTSLKYDIWAKDITPSDDLRKLFHLDPEKNWDVFAKAYEAEMKASPSLDALLNQIKEMHPSCVTLLYAFKNVQKNHAMIIQKVLEDCL